jgi:peptide/nickel transport system permease protein
MTRRLSGLLAILALAALIGPWIAPYDPEMQHREYLFAPPMRPHVRDHGSWHVPFVYPVRLEDRLAQRYEENRARRASLPWFADSDEPVFLLGADSFGRDVLSRLLHGSRLSLLLALTSVGGAVLLGALIGGLAGYRGGWLEETTLRVSDIVLVLPVMYVALLLRGVMPLVLAPSTVFLAMTAIFVLLGWPIVARAVHGLVAGEREREYVLAARSLGGGAGRILIHHLLPACRGLLLAQACLLLPAFILAEATLSYVGLGFPEHVPTWGTMLIEAANITALTRFPWTLTPAAAIFLVVLSANALVRSDCDPRMTRIARLTVESSD